MPILADFRGEPPFGPGHVEPGARQIVSLTKRENRPPSTFRTAILSSFSSRPEQIE